MIIHFKAAQNLVVEGYERYFDIIFHFNSDWNLVAEHYEREFLHAWSSTLWRFKTWLLKAMKDIWT